MNIPIEVLFLTSGVGALQSAFFGVYLFTLKKGRQVSNLLLALLLLAFAVRMIKSVTYYFAEGHDVPRLLQNVGYAANLAILPLLWLYLNSFLRNDFKLRWRRDIIHFAPSAFAVLLSPVLTSHFWMDQHGYTFSLLLMGCYIPFCFFLIYKHFQAMVRTHKIWIVCLTTGITVVWAGYTANFVFHLVPYITAPVIFSFVIYFMSYLGLQQNNIFIRETKYLNSTFSSQELESYFERLQHIMQENELFKDPLITLPKVARQLMVSTHLLSEAINKKGRQNFSDFVNTYRVAAAKSLLQKTENNHQKIATIAFETGFNSLSAFNASFKKITGQTPSEYRRQSTKA